MRYVVAICLVLFGCSQPPPTVSLSANPVSVKQGQCATLTWSSTNASNVAINPGVGKVDPNGSKQVCPGSTTPYSITATGDGGSQTASTTVNVEPPPPPPPPPQAAAPAPPPPTKVMTFSEAALFEFDKAELKPEGKDKIKEYRELAKEELSAAGTIAITGYTDNSGDSAYNSTLSLHRAEAVRDYLISLGADATKFQVSGAGEAKPVADNSTPEGRAKNRRVEVEVTGLSK